MTTSPLSPFPIGFSSSSTVSTATGKPENRAFVVV
jgi:hypothetical protein